MTQSLCSRCLGRLSPGRRYIGRILCDTCEATWRKGFYDRSQNNVLDRSERRAAPPAGSAAKPDFSTSD